MHHCKCWTCLCQVFQVNVSCNKVNKNLHVSVRRNINPSAVTIKSPVSLKTPLILLLYLKFNDFVPTQGRVGGTHLRGEALALLSIIIFSSSRGANSNKADIWRRGVIQASTIGAILWPLSPPSPSHVLHLLQPTWVNFSDIKCGHS